MKKKTSQKNMRALKTICSSTKELTRPSTISDSIKAPKRKPTRKNRRFGDDITNL
jgi:hypothetical protein